MRVRSRIPAHQSLVICSEAAAGDSPKPRAIQKLSHGEPGAELASESLRFRPPELGNVCPRRVYASTRQTLEIGLIDRLRLGWGGSHATQLRADAKAGGSLAEV